MRLLLLVALLMPAPEGFRDSARLAPIASGVSGKSVYVRCARTEDVWAALLAPWELPPSQVGGLTFPDNEGSYLAPDVCRQLEGWLRGKAVPTLRELARSALLLVHEAVHTRGVDDESVTDCTALRELPGVLRASFGIRRAVTLRAVMAFAWAHHRAKGPIFQTAC